jgi:Zn-dependent protease with chaperone function
MKVLHELSRDDMNKLFHSSKRKSTLHTIIAFCWLFFCLYMYLTTPMEKLQDSLLTFFIISVSVWVILSLSQIILLRLVSVPIDALKDEKIGNYSRDEIIAIANDVLNQSVKDEKPTVYVSNLDNANALVVNIYLLNFIKPANALYITRKCFEYLSKDEIKAILLHEMGHFNSFIYSGGRTMKFDMFFVIFMPFAFATLFDGWAWFLYILTVLATLRLLYKYIYGSISIRKHAIEYLSDLYASDKIGHLTTINALIAIGRVNEEKSTSKKKAEKLKEKIALPKRKLIKWASFDTEVVNGKIEPEEYFNFINLLESTKNPQVLKNAAIDKISTSHPSLTSRILFIHRNANQ